MIYLNEISIPAKVLLKALPGVTRLYRKRIPAKRSLNGYLLITKNHAFCFAPGIFD